MARKGSIGTGTLLILVLVGIILWQGGYLNNIQLPFSIGGGGTGDGLVNVNKQIKYTLTNKYAGAAIASSSNTISVYDSDGGTLLESDLDTDASGQGTTAFFYPSGKTIYFRYESTNDKKWWPVTVPKMNTQDAEAATYNLITLEAFAIGTYTSDTLTFGATTVTTTYNITASGLTKTFTYKLANSGSDNTGLMSSFDPLYDMNWNIVQYCVLTGTNYEKVIVYGFSKDFTLGSTHYLAKDLDAYALTLHKVGNTYKSGGTTTITFSIDATGYSGDAATMTLYTYAYSDSNYCANHGASYGPEAVQIATQAVTLQD